MSESNSQHGLAAMLAEGAAAVKQRPKASPTYRPLYSRVILRVLDEGKSKGGLYIPDRAQKSTPFVRGEVLAAGHGHVDANGNLRPLTVKKGDTVLFVRKVATMIPWGDEPNDCALVEESQVLCIEEPAPLVELA